MNHVDEAMALWGKPFSRLVRLRTLSDYGTVDRVPAGEAEDAVDTAYEILRAVAAGNPTIFTLSA